MAALLRAIAQGNASEATRLVEEDTEQALRARDQEGNTALHVAVLWSQHAVLCRLLARGARVDVANQHGFTALHLASAMRDRVAVCHLVQCDVAQRWVQWAHTIARHAAGLAEAPDFRLKIDWHLTTVVPFAGYVLPSDTYTVYKQGSSLRIDYSLPMSGLTALSAERVQRSLLFRPSSEPNSPSVPQAFSLVQLDHAKATFANVRRPLTVEEVARSVEVLTTSPLAPTVVETASATVKPGAPHPSKPAALAGAWDALSSLVHSGATAPAGPTIAGFSVDEVVVGGLVAATARVHRPPESAPAAVGAAAEAPRVASSRQELATCNVWVCKDSALPVRASDVRLALELLVVLNSQAAWVARVVEAASSFGVPLKLSVPVGTMLGSPVFASVAVSQVQGDARLEAGLFDVPPHFTNVAQL